MKSGAVLQCPSYDSRRAVAGFLLGARRFTQPAVWSTFTVIRHLPRPIAFYPVFTHFLPALPRFRFTPFYPKFYVAGCCRYPPDFVLPLALACFTVGASWAFVAEEPHRPTVLKLGHCPLKANVRCLISALHQEGRRAVCSP